MDQDATWYGGWPRLGYIVLNGDSAPLPRKEAPQPPAFRGISIVAKRSSISATAELFLFIHLAADVGKGDELPAYVAWSMASFTLRHLFT